MEGFTAKSKMSPCKMHTQMQASQNQLEDSLCGNVELVAPSQGR